MGQEADQIREEIAETRQQLGDTLEQLARKANVNGRARDWVANKKQAVADKVEQAKATVADKFAAAKDAVTTQRAGAAQDADAADAPTQWSSGPGRRRQRRLTAAGQAGLTGWRAKVAGRLSRPIAARTRLTKPQVEAIIGGVFVVITIVQFVSLIRRLSRAAARA